MNALRIPDHLIDQPTKAPPAPRGVQYIPLREACFRSGAPMETLARRCRGEWSRSNLAALMRPIDGGKECWHVREDADPLFARAKSPELLPIDWSKLNDKQRASVRRRHSLLLAWLDAREEGFSRRYSERESTAAFVQSVRDDGQGVSRGSLYRWLDGFNAAGLSGLIDNRLNEKHVDLFADLFIEELKRLYLNSKRRTKALCFDLACEIAEARNWSIPFDKRQAQRILAAIPQKVVAYHREGARAYSAQFGKHVVRDYSKLASNQLWVSDGYTMDISVNVGGKLMRPTLVSWMDVRSRYIVGWRIVARAENADVILAAFRMGVKNHGAPEIVFHDNGEAYDSAALQGVTKRGRRAGVLPNVDLGLFPRLEIGVKHSLPYNAKAKMNERWHRVVKERFCTRFDTYTGGAPDEKPFDLEAQKRAGKSPSLEEVIEAFESWIKVDYAMKEHGGADMDNAAPAEVFAKHLQRKRVIDDRVLLIETCRRELLKVGRNGVSWRGIIYEAPELDRMTGESVHLVIDDSNVNKVLILHAGGAQKGAAICEAKVMGRLDVIASEEDTRAAIAEQRRDLKRVREAGPARMRLKDDPIDRLNRIAKTASNGPTPSPERLQPVRTGTDASPLKIAQDEPRVGKFGYYSQFAPSDVNSTTEDK